MTTNNISAITSTQVEQLKQAELRAKHPNVKHKFRNNTEAVYTLYHYSNKPNLEFRVSVTLGKKVTDTLSIVLDFLPDIQNPGLKVARLAINEISALLATDKTNKKGEVVYGQTFKYVNVTGKFTDPDTDEIIIKETTIQQEHNLFNPESLIQDWAKSIQSHLAINSVAYHASEKNKALTPVEWYTANYVTSPLKTNEEYIYSHSQVVRLYILPELIQYADDYSLSGTIPAFWSLFARMYATSVLSRTLSLTESTNKTIFTYIDYLKLMLVTSEETRITNFRGWVVDHATEAQKIELGFEIKIETQEDDKLVKHIPHIEDTEAIEVSAIKITEPEITEPEITEPAITEPAITEPAITEPAITEPAITEPVKKRRIRTTNCI